MNRHLKRFGWLYLMLFAVMAYPSFIVYMQRVPKYDVPTLHRLDRLIQDGFARSHPDVKIKHHTAGDDFNISEHNRELIMGSLAVQGQNLAAMPAVQPELDHVTDLCAPEFDKLDKLINQNILFFPASLADSTSTRKSVNPPDIPNYLAINTSSKIRRAQAEAAISERRWDDALRLLESTARISDPSRYSSTTGPLAGIAARAIAYSGYGHLLNAAPPTEVAQTASKTLVSFRETDPEMDRWAWGAEKILRIRSDLHYNGRSRPDLVEWYDDQDEQSFLNRHNFWMIDNLRAIVTIRSRIKDPVLKAWAERFARINPRGESIDYAQPLSTRMNWTTIPSARKWFKELARKEPWVYHDPIMPENEYPKLDHWTLMMVEIDSLVSEDYLGGKVRTRVGKTQRCLAEAGFASLLNKYKCGAWPTELNQLSEFYQLPSSNLLAGDSSTSDSQGAYLPIRIAEREITPELRPALWQHIFGMSNWTCFQNRREAIQPDGSFRFVAPRLSREMEWFEEPVRVVAIEQLLKSHPNLLESAQLEAATTSVPTQDVLEGKGLEATMSWMPGMMPGIQGMPEIPPGMMPGMSAASAKAKKPAPPAVFRPLDAVLARQITEDSYRLKAYQAAKTGDRKASFPIESTYNPSIAIPPTADVTTITQPNFIRIDEIRLTGKLRAPEKAMVIWSPGPDGKDDNGEIVYDATNGTVSRGDIVLFPENY